MDMEPRIRVADEVWIATALLQFENPEAKDFTSRQLIDRVETNNYFGTVRPGVSIHISQHCVADKPANPGNYRMLASSGANGRNRRLFRDGDPIGKGRENGKRVPYLSEIPYEHRDEAQQLLEWWSTQEGAPSFSVSDNSRIAPMPVKVRLNQIRLSEDIYPFFESFPDLRGMITKIRDLEIAEQDEDGNSIDRYRNRQTTIKVGYALEIIEEKGLLKTFKEVLADSSRTIKESYVRWYHENQNQLRYSRRVSSRPGNLDSPEAESAFERREEARPRRNRGAIFATGPDPQSTAAASVSTNEPAKANRIHLTYDIQPFFDDYAPENAYLAADDAPLRIADLDEEGKSTSYYKDRSVTIRIGYLLAEIRKLGLIGEFEDVLEVSGRTINARYEELYRRNNIAISDSLNP